MKFVMIVIASVLMVACSDSAKEVSFPAMPPELKECKVFYVTNEKGNGLYVVRCPNSTTTTHYSTGKTSKTVVVVDGVEYEKKDSK